MSSRRLLAPLVFALLLFGGWEWAVRTYHPGSPFLPTPSAILGWFWEASLDGSLAEATLVTLRRLALGFALGAVLGLVIGGLCARSRTVRDAIGWG